MPVDRSKRPRKPRKNFPLWPQLSGSWCAVVGGRRRSFGGWARDPLGERALLRYEAMTKAIAAGQPPPAFAPGTARLDELFGAFLLDRESRVGKPEYAQYKKVLRMFSDAVGPSREAESLLPPDFARVRAAWAAAVGPYKLQHQIMIVRMAFRWAEKMGHTSRLPRYGEGFNASSAAERRRAVREREEREGPKLFTPEEVRKLLKQRMPAPLRAMILLGLNCAFLSVDCARLRERDLDLSSGRLEFVRHKRETLRQAVLWPETIKSIKAALKARPKAENAADADRVFLNRSGRAVNRDAEEGTRRDNVCAAFRVACEAAGVYRRGRGYSALRPTQRTIADETGDRNAALRILGHTFTAMDAHYVRDVPWERIEKVCNHVRKVLLGGTK